MIITAAINRVQTLHDLAPLLEQLSERVHEETARRSADIAELDLLCGYLSRIRRILADFRDRAHMTGNGRQLQPWVKKMIASYRDLDGMIKERLNDVRRTDGKPMVVKAARASALIPQGMTK